VKWLLVYDDCVWKVGTISEQLYFGKDHFGISVCKISSQSEYS